MFTGAKLTSYIHATAVVIAEAGVLVLGPSGSGKSTFAFALIAAAEGEGYFARLVGDDRIGVQLQGNRLIAFCHPAILGKLERRGQGIIDVAFLRSAVLRLAIRLDDAASRFPGPDQDQISLEGARLPLLNVRQNAANSCGAIALIADLRRLQIIP